MKFSIVTLLLMILFGASVSYADSSSFSSQTVENWIKAQQALEHWGETHRDKIAQFEHQGNARQNPMTITDDDMLKPLKKAGLYHSAQAVIMEYGFEGLEQWANTSIRISKIAVAIELESQTKTTDTSELQALLDSPQISKQQKEIITEAIERNRAIMHRLTTEVSDSDKNTVRPFLERIRNVTDSRQSASDKR